MTVLSYQTIKKYCQEFDLITPYREKTVHLESGLTGGVSNCGYDLHIAQGIRLYPVNLKNTILNLFGFRRFSFSLASTVESFKLPANIVCNVVDKSTLARQGLSVFNTCIEPGWVGKTLTLELVNNSNKIIYLKKGQPIAQAIFMFLDEPTQKPYQGKYNNAGPYPQEAIYEKI